jgi:hypothetical protein
MQHANAMLAQHASLQHTWHKPILQQPGRCGQSSNAGHGVFLRTCVSSWERRSAMATLRMASSFTM